MVSSMQSTMDSTQPVLNSEGENKAKLSSFNTAIFALINLFDDDEDELLHWGQFIDALFEEGVASNIASR
jgi:hypothetical protein